MNLLPIEEFIEQYLNDPRIAEHYVEQLRRAEGVQIEFNPLASRYTNKIRIDDGKRWTHAPLIKAKLEWTETNIAWFGKEAIRKSHAEAAYETISFIRFCINNLKKARKQSMKLYAICDDYVVHDSADDALRFWRSIQAISDKLYEFMGFPKPIELDDEETATIMFANNEITMRAKDWVAWFEQPAVISWAAKSETSK